MKEIWTSESKYTFEENIKFIKKKWSLKVAEKFVFKTFSGIDNILKNPKIGEFDENWKAYKLLIVPQIYLYYEIVDDAIIILCFWNNFQKN